jgi:hypothetical protein
MTRVRKVVTVAAAVALGCTFLVLHGCKKQQTASGPAQEQLRSGVGTGGGGAKTPPPGAKLGKGDPSSLMAPGSSMPAEAKAKFGK